jgi:hypothetical protein
MQVDDRLRFCTGFVGTGTSENFVAHGTCFCVFMADGDFTFDYFISAQHLLWPQRRKNPQSPPDTPMVVRLNTKVGTSRVVQTSPKAWIYPTDPTVDVCAFRFSEIMHDASDELEVNSINLDTMTIGGHPLHTAEAVGMSLGDEVFICGAFVGRVGYRKNIPVVRIANIAAMPEEPIDFASPKQPAYLIETRSIGGTSGSPVFLNLQEHRVRRRTHGYRIGMTRATPDNQEQTNTTHLILPYLLLGMFISFHGGNYLQDFVVEEDSEIHPLKDADFNAGIGVALPVSVIIDLLNSTAAKEARMKEVEAKRKQSGARPASAIRHLGEEDEGSAVGPPATDANSTHREDFNSLLGAAVRKPEPID